MSASPSVAAESSASPAAPEESATKEAEPECITLSSEDEDDSVPMSTNTTAPGSFHTKC